MIFHHDRSHYNRFFENLWINNYDYLLRNEKNQDIMLYLYDFIGNLALNSEISETIMENEKFFDNLHSKISNENSEILTSYYVILGNMIISSLP